MYLFLSLSLGTKGCVLFSGHCQCRGFSTSIRLFLFDEPPYHSERIHMRDIVLYIPYIHLSFLSSIILFPVTLRICSPCVSRIVWITSSFSRFTTTRKGSGTVLKKKSEESGNKPLFLPSIQSAHLLNF